jgi:hypothetical protein
MPRRPQAPRPTWHCLRCGYDWVGNSLAHPPARCLRCRSFYWDREPEKPSLARKPSDPPNPKWKVMAPRVAKRDTGPVRIKFKKPWPWESDAPGLPPPPQLADFADNGDRKVMNVRFPAAPMPPPRFDEPTPESFAHPTPELALESVPDPVDARTEALVDAVVAALVPAEPPEPAADLAAEADIRESEYIEEAT